MSDATHNTAGTRRFGGSTCAETLWQGLGPAALKPAWSFTLTWVGPGWRHQRIQFKTGQKVWKAAGGHFQK